MSSATANPLPKNLLLFIVSTLSISYELLIAKTLVTFTDNVPLWKSITIAVYIAGLGWGTFRAFQLPHGRRIENLFRVELALSTLGAMVVPVLLFGHIWYRITLYPLADFIDFFGLRPLDVFCILAQFPTLLLGYLSGHELPLIDAESSEKEKLKKVSRWLVTMNLGALTGTLLLTALFKTQLSLATCGMFLASVNALLALYIWKTTKLSSTWPRLAGAALCFSVLVSVGVFSERLTQFSAQNFFYNHISWRVHPDSTVEMTGPQKGLGLIDFLLKKPEILRIRSDYQIIEWVPDDGSTGGHRLYLNRHFQLSTQDEANYHQAMTLAPLSQHGLQPRSALILGGGDGLLARDLLKLRPFGLQKIKLVELDEMVLHFAKTHPPLKELNEAALESPHVETVSADAFLYARLSKEKWDFILLDFPYPYSTDVFKLYTKEFYGQIFERLNPGGVVVLDFPFEARASKGGKRDLRSIICSTLQAAGFQNIIPYRGKEESFVSAQRFTHSAQAESEKTTSTSALESYIEEKNLFFRREACTPTKELVNNIFRPTLFAIQDPTF